MEIVLRTATIFLELWLIISAIGRPTFGELRSLELLLFITMGDLVQQGIAREEHSVAGGLLAGGVGTVAVLTVLLGWANVRWPGLSRLVHGAPEVTLHSGPPDTNALRAEREGPDDPMSAARGQGFRNLSEIDLAVSKLRGTISDFAKDLHPSDGPPRNPNLFRAPNLS